MTSFILRQLRANFAGSSQSRTGQLLLAGVLALVALLTWWADPPLSSRVILYVGLATILVIVIIAFLPERRTVETEEHPTSTIMEPSSTAWAQSVLHLGVEFGPNGNEVANFLARLPNLTSHDWEVVRQRFEHSNKSYVVFLSRSRAEGQALRTIERVCKQKRLDEAVRAVAGEVRVGLEQQLFPSTPPAVLAAIWSASKALIARPFVSSESFFQLYRYFSGIVPVEQDLKK